MPLFNINRTRAVGFLLIVCVKILLIPSYFSTDFDVHRNWMAITHTLPLSQWYTEDTSQWTLDYPPLFGWFEFCVSHLVKPFAPSLLAVLEDETRDADSLTGRYSGHEIMAHRMTIIVADVVLFLAVCFYVSWRYPGDCGGNGNKKKGGCGRAHSAQLRSEDTVVLLTLFTPALLLVDHVHFQYNGFLLGLLIFSFGCVRRGYDVLASVQFMVVVNFKHLYACLGPLYAVYMIKHYCFLGGGDGNGDSDDVRDCGVGGTERRILTRSAARSTSTTTTSSSSPSPKSSTSSSLASVHPSTTRATFLSRFLFITIASLSVALVSFGPFIYHNQVTIVLGRMFPLHRGLLHAYWAPNFWALYAFVDKIASFVMQRLGYLPSLGVASLTAGTVGQAATFGVFPTVTPVVSVFLMIVSQLPILYRVWNNPRPSSFLFAVPLCAFSYFFFAWHVHEKAILTVLVPLGLLLSHSSTHSVDLLVRVYRLLCPVATLAVFPLLYKQSETGMKVCFLLLGWLLCFSHTIPDSGRRFAVRVHSHVLALLLRLKDRGEALWRTWRRQPRKEGERRSQHHITVDLDHVIAAIVAGGALLAVYHHLLHALLFGDRLPFLPLMMVSVYCAAAVTFSMVLFVRVFYSQTAQ